MDESILVVPRTAIIPLGGLYGVTQINNDTVVNLVEQYGAFKPRTAMETDHSHKQLIPYIVFIFEQKLFVMQRTETASEQRLKNKYTIGIGGHIREQDITKKSDICAWALREFHEEISYTGQITMEFIGVINDDTNDVGKVHLGCLIVMKGDSPMIAVRSELKQGMLMTLHEAMNYHENMESWSQHVLDYIINAHVLTKK